MVSVKTVKRNYEMVEEKKTEDIPEMVEEKNTDDAHELLPFDDGTSSTSSILKKVKKGEEMVGAALLTEKRGIVSFTGVGDSPASAANIPTGASRDESLERKVKKLRRKMTEEKKLVKQIAKHCREKTEEHELKDKQIKNVRKPSLVSSIRSCVLALASVDTSPIANSHRKLFLTNESNITLLLYHFS
jgi:hypothetical protein